jgi:hypothetical protein
LDCGFEIGDGGFVGFEVEVDAGACAEGFEGCGREGEGGICVGEGFGVFLELGCGGIEVVVVSF